MQNSNGDFESAVSRAISFASGHQDLGKQAIAIVVGAVEDVQATGGTLLRHLFEAAQLIELTSAGMGHRVWAARARETSKRRRRPEDAETRQAWQCTYL